MAVPAFEADFAVALVGFELDRRVGRCQIGGQQCRERGYAHADGFFESHFLHLSDCLRWAYGKKPLCSFMQVMHNRPCDAGAANITLIPTVPNS